jgi:Fe-S cluster assembly protein SufD
MFDQLPHRGLEDWKWSDVRAAAGGFDSAALEQAATLGLNLPSGIDEQSADDLEAFDGDLPRLAATFAPDAMTVVIPAGDTPELPLEITPATHGNARMVVVVGEGASLTVNERYANEERGFSNLDIRYIVKDGGTLTRTVVTQDGAEVVRNVRASVTLSAGANFKQTQLTFGSALTRLETRVACMGTVEIEMSGAYLLSGKRHADITNYIDFTTSGSVVRDAVAGVVTDKSRGVFQGKFHVRRPAQQTDAVMRHDALMLSDTAKINAKPELEIYADDVLCEHGNTIGQLDEQAMFYMRQRGIPKAEARALLIEAFVVARLGEDDALKALVRDWLDRQA